MKSTKLVWWAAAIATVGLMSACGGDTPPDEPCADVNNNGICDDAEPGHGQCDAEDRDAQGVCPEAPPHCTGTQILVDDACEDCPTGDVAQDNVCVTPSVTCEANEIVVDDACVDCGSDATATNNECVPHCETTQILVNNVCVDCAPGQVNDGNNACVSDTPDTCDDGEILVDDACCADANENGLCDVDEPGDELCPVEERDEFGECPTVCAPELENSEGSCTCADLDMDAVCDSDPADDCFGIENGDDQDGDGFCSDLDCDDNDNYTYPGAVEICGHSVVNDCNNPCYDTACDAADLQAAKEGRVGELSYGVVSVWADVTDDVSGPGKVYEAEGHGALYFCGPVTYEVDLRASGSAQRLVLHSGLNNFSPTLSAAGEDRPVISVEDGATVAVNRLSVEHKAGFSGDNGHGLFCDNAMFSLFNAQFSHNAAKLGGGVYANACTFSLEGSVGFNSNSAYEGAGMFITGGSGSEAKGGNFQFGANITENSNSAALHVEAESKVLWNLGATEPAAAFRGNKDTSDQPRDIRVATDALLGIRSASFLSPGVDHVQTDGSTHQYSTSVDLNCTGLLCTP